MQKIRSIIVLLLAVTPLSLAAQEKQAAKEKSPPKVKEAKLGATRNVHQCGKLYLAGQPTEADFSVIKKAGVKRVITLRTDGEVDWDEAAKVKAAGMEFITAPIGSPDDLTNKLLDKLRKLLAESDKKPTVLHCASANRVGAVWMTHRVLNEGVPIEQARKEAKTVGLRSSAMEAKVIDYIKQAKKKAKSKAPANKQSIRPGINRNFLDPKMEIAQWLDRFEDESREIFSSREAILAEMPIKPGMRVADVGAGTGFFARLLSDRVGEKGWVFAVDISPTFIKHISDSADKFGVRNMTPVLAAGDDIRLPAESIDLVYICDTYHHFEYPEKSLASIHRALRDGGALVLIDFERIPGVSREFIIGHVRAGKETFRQEIEAAGFGFEREAKVEGLKENYFLVFRKR